MVGITRQKDRFREEDTTQEQQVFSSVEETDWSNLKYVCSSVNGSAIEHKKRQHHGVCMTTLDSISLSKTDGGKMPGLIFLGNIQLLNSQPHL